MRVGWKLCDIILWTNVHSRHTRSEGRWAREVRNGKQAHAAMQRRPRGQRRAITHCVRALASTSPSISRDTRKSLGHGAHCRISGVHHGSGYFFGVLVAPARTRHGPRRGLLRWHDRISACSTLFDCFVETCMIPNSAPGRNTSN
jgi:hypothetical protein